MHFRGCRNNKRLVFWQALWQLACVDVVVGCLVSHILHHTMLLPNVNSAVEALIACSHTTQAQGLSLHVTQTFLTTMRMTVACFHMERD